MSAPPPISQAKFLADGIAPPALKVAPQQRVARKTLLIACVLGSAMFVFAYATRIDVVASYHGTVIPVGQDVHPPETGVVRSIAVQNGQTVKTGDVLVELDAVSSMADFESLQRELWESEAEVQRTMALTTGQSTVHFSMDIPPQIAATQEAAFQAILTDHYSLLAGLDAEINKHQADVDASTSNVEQLQHNLPLLQQKHRMYTESARSSYVGVTLLEVQTEMLIAQKDLALQTSRLKESQASLQAAVQRRHQAAVESKTRSRSELSSAVKKRDAARQAFFQARQRMTPYILRSPMDGTVQQLTTITVGGIVRKEHPLLTVTSGNSPLEVETWVSDRDAGHLRAGQRVINKLDAYDFTRYGHIEGEVLRVGTAAVQDPTQGTVYPVRIRLLSTETPHSVNGRKGIVMAGMNVTLDVLTDRRRLIDFALQER